MRKIDKNKVYAFIGRVTVFILAHVWVAGILQVGPKVRLYSPRRR